METCRDDGYSLPELLVAMAVLLVVLVVTLAMLDLATGNEASQQARSQTHDEVRLAMDRLTKEARQALSVASGSTASRLDMQTLLDDVAHRVVYEAAGGLLRRSVDGGEAAVLLRGLTSTAVFTYDPPAWSTAPDVITVRLSARTGGLQAATITLSSDVRLRNRPS